jgi:uncharacterized iron-regulated membrane protein
MRVVQLEDAAVSTLVLTALVRRLHIYAGLLTFAQLTLYGIAGLVASVQPGLERPKQVRAVRYEPFDAEPGATDKEVARAVWQALQLPLTRPMPDWFLQHTADGDLQLDFYNVNGIYRVVVLEKEKRLRIESIRNALGLFLSDMHAATTGDREAPQFARVWAVYNEAGMWCLLGFCVSGVYLWLITRWRDPWAWVSLASGGGALALVCGVMR